MGLPAAVLYPWFAGPWYLLAPLAGPRLYALAVLAGIGRNAVWKCYLHGLTLRYMTEAPHILQAPGDLLRRRKGGITPWPTFCFESFPHLGQVALYTTSTAARPLSACYYFLKGFRLSAVGCQEVHYKAFKLFKTGF